MKIAFLGTDINNSNLGCQALTWSAMYIFECIRKRNNFKFEYYIFEATPNEKKIKEIVDDIGIERNALNIVHLGCVTDPLRMFKYIKRNQKVFKLLRECDIAFDATRGDSFSDLYGNNVFRTFAIYKKYILKRGIPLVLLPQTYGPFLNNKNIRYAKKIFEQSEYIFSRDQLSDDMVYEICRKRTIVTTDMAFQLPCRVDKTTNKKIKIGINISGLLSVSKINEYNKNIKINTKYNEIIKKIINALLMEEKYDVYLIPHVKSDVSVINYYKEQFTKLKVVEYVDNPILIKEKIAKMDIFIGSRMHATIGAVSMGVFTIPLAYSRKFKGLFELLDYGYTIDLEESTEEIIEKIMSYIFNVDSEKDKLSKTLDIIEQYNLKTNSIIEKIVKKYYR